jgi:hypothetical protein
MATPCPRGSTRSYTRETIGLRRGIARGQVTGLDPAMASPVRVELR